MREKKNKKQEKENKKNKNKNKKRTRKQQKEELQQKTWRWERIIQSLSTEHDMSGTITK